MKSQTPFPVVPYPIATRSYNLRRILIALGAAIAEMAFPGKVGMDISRNDHHPQVRLHVIRYLPSYYRTIHSAMPPWGELY